MTLADRAPAFDVDAWLSAALSMQGLAAVGKDRAAVAAFLSVAHRMRLEIPDDAEAS